MQNEFDQKKAQTTDFVNRYHQYVVDQKKIQFPILDSLLKQYPLLFAQQNEKKDNHPEGTKLNNISSVSQTTLIQLLTFLDNFPYSNSFSIMSETKDQPYLVSTPFQKIASYLIQDKHSFFTLQGCHFYSTQEAQEQQNRTMFKLLTFFIDDIQKYKMNLLKPSDILKQKMTEEEVKREKNIKKLFDNSEKEQQQTINEQKYQFENGSAESSNFWQIIFDLFNKILKKAQKNNKNDQKEKELQNDNEDDEAQERRKQNMLKIYLNQTKQKEQYKKRSKLNNKLQMLKNFKTKEKCYIFEDKSILLLFQCYINSWPAILLQLLKIPYIQEIIQKNELMQNIGNNEFGYFKLTFKEKIQFSQILMEAASETESFKTIIDYRQEMIQVISQMLEMSQEQLENLNQLIQTNQNYELLQQQQKLRSTFKKQLQLVEFDKLFVNGCQYLGQDVNQSQYYIFSSDIQNLYQLKDDTWKIIDAKGFEQLAKTLSIYGVNENKLLENCQKLIACELINDNETISLLKRDTITQVSNKKGDVKILQQVAKILIDSLNTFTKSLTMQHLRWESPQIRHSTILALNQLNEVTQFKEIFRIFIEQFEVAQVLVLNVSKFKSKSELILLEQRINDYSKQGIRMDNPEEILFHDQELFDLMEQKQVIIDSGKKQQTKLWQYTLGLDLKELMLKLLDNLSNQDYYNLQFLANLFQFCISEYEQIIISNLSAELMNLREGILSSKIVIEID